MDVQNELIAMSMSSKSSCKEQLQQINQKLSSEQLQVDTQFKLDQLENVGLALIGTHITIVFNTLSMLSYASL